MVAATRPPPPTGASRAGGGRGAPAPDGGGGGGQARQWRRRAVPHRREGAVGPAGDGTVHSPRLTRRGRPAGRRRRPRRCRTPGSAGLDTDPRHCGGVCRHGGAAAAGGKQVTGAAVLQGGRSTIALLDAAFFLWNHPDGAIREGFRREVLCTTLVWRLTESLYTTGAPQDNEKGYGEPGCQRAPACASPRVAA